jgi:tetratricopeptide (TPR) repeat protein
MNTNGKLLLLNLLSIFISFSLFAQTADEYYRIGYYKSRDKKYDSSIIYFTKAIGLKSNYANFYAARGDSKAHLKDFKGAMQDYDTALRLDSNNCTAYYNIACVYSFKKNVEKGFLYLEKAIEKGFDSEYDLMYYLMNDPDLSFLRSQKRFGKFVQKYKVN